MIQIEIKSGTGGSRFWPGPDSRNVHTTQGWGSVLFVKCMLCGCVGLYGLHQTGCVEYRYAPAPRQSETGNYKQAFIKHRTKHPPSACTCNLCRGCSIRLDGPSLVVEQGHCETVPCPEQQETNKNVLQDVPFAKNSCFPRTLRRPQNPTNRQWMCLIIPGRPRYTQRCRQEYRLQPSHPSSCRNPLGVDAMVQDKQPGDRKEGMSDFVV